MAVAGLTQPPLEAAGIACRHKVRRTQRVADAASDRLRHMVSLWPKLARSGEVRNSTQACCGKPPLANRYDPMPAEVTPLSFGSLARTLLCYSKLLCYLTCLPPYRQITVHLQPSSLTLPSLAHHPAHPYTCGCACDPLGYPLKNELLNTADTVIVTVAPLTPEAVCVIPELRLDNEVSIRQQRGKEVEGRCMEVDVHVHPQHAKA